MRFGLKIAGKMDRAYCMGDWDWDPKARIVLWCGYPGCYRRSGRDGKREKEEREKRTKGFSPMDKMGLKEWNFDIFSTAKDVRSTINRYVILDRGFIYLVLYGVYTNNVETSPIDTWSALQATLRNMRGVPVSHHHLDRCCTPYTQSGCALHR